MCGCGRRDRHEALRDAPLLRREGRERQVLVAVARSAPVQHGRLARQCGVQQPFLNIAQEVPYVQTKAQAVVCEEVAAQTEYIAVRHILQQQGRRALRLCVPKTCEIRQHAALQRRGTLRRV